MARGTGRAPSQHAYRGALGRTQTTTVHVAGSQGELVPAQVHTTIDAVADSELVERLHSDDPARALNSVQLDGGEWVRIAIPVLYHDPAAELLVLVLGDAHRHRELDERIRVLEALRASDAPVPVYAKELTVAYGAAGLRALLEQRAQDALHAARAQDATRDATREDQRRRDEQARRAKDLDASRAELDLHAHELETTRRELDNLKADLAGRTAELARERAELARDRAELARDRAALARDRAALDRARSESRRSVLPEVDGDSETFERVEPTRDLGPVADRAESFGEMFGEFGTAGATIPGAEPVILALPARSAVRRDTDDVITGSQQATRGPATGHISMGEPAESPSAREAEVDLIDIIDTGVIPSLDLDAALMAPEAATTEVGGPDPRPADSTVVAPTPRAAASDWTEDETTGASIPQGADPLTTETVEPADAGAADAWLDKQIAAQTSAFTVEGGTPRLALVADEALARGLQGHLDVRVLMHRTARYPVIMLVLGPPAAFRIPTPAQLAVLSLDIGNDRDRAVLAALGRRFELVVDVIVGARRVRRVRLLAPLAENVGYILRAAEDHLRGVAVEGEPSLARARELVTSAGFDLLGTNHLEAVEFRDDKLAQLATAQQARRAIAMARRFARPSREDYLVCTRGFPLTRWRELRRHVLETAVAWGLWMGPELAQVAVSEGLARSRRDLVVKLDRGTEALRRNRDANDVDDDATNDNATALAEEAKALGVELKAGATGTNGATGATGQSELRVPSPPGGAGPSGATTSEDGAQVSGSIGGTPATGMPTVKPLPARPAMAAPPALRKHTVDQLLALLEDRDQRVAAAVELCERGDARAAGPVVATVGKLSRAEAVKVLGMAVKFGDAAKGPLLEGLKSSKAFLRHGSALALGLLRTEDGTQAVIDLLLTEPTEIWREVARAIGQVGPTALLTLASTYGRLGDKATPALAERVAWAMAHVAVRGGRAAIETMAGGHSVVAPVAKHALELHASAANDHVRVRPGHEASAAGRDMTVNRAFSRKFFEALEEGLPETGAAALEALDASSPMELLDESDLIDDDEDAEEAFGDGSEVLADGSEVIDDLDDEIDEANLISR